MDLSFPRFDKDVQVTALPNDLAVLLVGIAARQAASPTAISQTRIVDAPDQHALLAPLDGAFNGPVAATLATWRKE